MKMNPEDEYQTWLNKRRGESPSTELTDRIMSAVREASMSSSTSQPAKQSPKTAWQPAIPYLVCSAAALVLAVRIYSILSLFLAPSAITDVAMIEPSKEIAHER